MDAISSPRFEALSYDDIPNWLEDDHLEALEAFRWSARRIAKKPYKTKALGVDADALAKIALRVLEDDFEGANNQQSARQFFEDNFEPHKIITSQGNGFVTGYFEPEIEASLRQSEEFKYPILKRPADLVAISDEQRPADMDESFFFARKTANGFVEFPDRPAIENGALDGQNLEIFWFRSRIEIFFIHIQGSARLILPDGDVRRISYDGKSGHPFTPIGKLLIDRGQIQREDVTMQSIRAWLEAHEDKSDELMQQNKSYIFFQEIDHPEPKLGPVAAAGVPLTKGRSLAIDHRLHTFGLPIYIVTKKALPKSNNNFKQLMITQDTGSAIIGPTRGDLFMGTGIDAGEIAGGIKHEVDFIALIPRS